MANIIKFEVGAEYWDTSAVDHNDVMTVKITRRTEKSVWFVRMHGGKEDGEPSRTKVFANNSYEYIMPYRYSMAPVWEADRKVEPEQTATEAAEETAETEQSAAGETDATGNEKEGLKMGASITFKRVYEYGGDCKADDTDYICGYRASNGAMIEKKYADGLNVYCWKVGESYYDTLNVAKNAVIRKAENAAEPATETETPDAAQEDAPEAEVYERMENLRIMGRFLNKFIADGNRTAAHGVKDDIDRVIAVDKEYGVVLSVEYDADGRFVDVRERTETADDGAEAGQPAPQAGAAPEGAESVEAELSVTYAKRNPVASYDIFHYHSESGTFLFQNEGEAALIDALNFHADRENALSVVNALYEITHDGGGWFSPRNHPVMLDALNAYINFMTEEIEVFDNFPNAAEKEIAVGKLAEAKVIRDAFAADVGRAAA